MPGRNKGISPIPSSARTCDLGQPAGSGRRGRPRGPSVDSARKRGLSPFHQCVTLIVDARDELSGIASITPAQLVFSKEGTNLVGFATATDRAGNAIADASAPVKIDLTPPTITFVSRLPAANANRWNNTDITARWQCADRLSGVAADTVFATLSTEGANQSLSGRCTDVAGNVGTDIQGGFNLDKTPPIMACVAGPAMLWPANNKLVLVSVALTFTDALSGTQSFAMTGLSSNEPGTGDITGFTVGQPALSGELRAQRLRPGGGRTYTLGYQGGDLAGTTASCQTLVTVPHDRSDSKKQ